MNKTFEDHCWKDVMDEEMHEVYSSYNRETHVGRNPALLAIDLYNLVFEGGPTPVQEVVKEHKKSCGLYAHNAIKPIQELIALARAQHLPVVYTTSETRDEVNPAGVYRQAQVPGRKGSLPYPRGLQAPAGRPGNLQAAGERVLRHRSGYKSHPPRDRQLDRLRREHERMCARLGGRCLLLRLSRRGSGRMLL